MFVAIALFPEVPTEREEDFQEWFAWSNDQLRHVDGLKGRRLLRAPDGTYTALVEHKSAETFAAMHTTEVASQVHLRLGEILNDGPRATKYEVIVDLSTSGSCCGGRGGHHGGHGGHRRAAAADSAEPQVAGGCCH